MKAVVWHGNEDVRVDEVPDPKIQEPTDAIIRVTSSGICGSDLHLYGVLGMLVAPITSTALKSAPSEFAGIASGVNSTVSRLGNLIAVAAIGVVISLIYNSQVSIGTPLARNQVDQALRDASIDGFRVGMIVAAGLAFAGAAVAAVGIVNREDEPDEVSEQAPAPAGN